MPQCSVVLLTVDQLNKVLDVLGTAFACLFIVVLMDNLGTPDENVIKKIGSEKASNYENVQEYLELSPPGSSLRSIFAAQEKNTLQENPTSGRPTRWVSLCTK